MARTVLLISEGKLLEANLSARIHIFLAHRTGRHIHSASRRRDGELSLFCGARIHLQIPAQINRHRLSLLRSGDVHRMDSAHISVLHAGRISFAEACGLRRDSGRAAVRTGSRAPLAHCGDGRTAANRNLPRESHGEACIPKHITAPAL